MPAFKAAYLIHGDDHGRIGERRARLRAMAEAESGSAGIEVYEAEACTPETIAAALSTMTFALGRRFVIADGVERWKDSEVEPVVTALAQIDPEALTVAFFAREEGRYKPPAALEKAVKAAGGVVAAEMNAKPWELPRWLAAQARDMGLELAPDAAKALVAQVGDRQQRLLRELEKLALEHGPGARLGVDEVLESCASSAERKVWTLADVVAAGDPRAATRVFLELRQQGERLPNLQYKMVQRLRDALAVAEALAAGKAPAQIKRGLRMSPRNAERFVADVSKRDVEAYRRALVVMADLELESRGGGGAALGEDTAAVRAVLAAAG